MRVGGMRVSDGVADAYSSFLPHATNIELLAPTDASNKTESAYFFRLSTLPALHQELVVISSDARFSPKTKKATWIKGNKEYSRY